MRHYLHITIFLAGVLGLISCSTNGDIVMDGEYHEYINNGRDPIKVCQYKPNYTEDRVTSWRFECI